MLVVLAAVVGVMAVALIIALFQIHDVRSDFHDIVEELRTLEVRVRDVPQHRHTESVPVRDKCTCGHSALAHHNKSGSVYEGEGCSAGFLFLTCSCPASRDEVLYTPEAMKRIA